MELSLRFLANVYTHTHTNTRSESVIYLCSISSKVVVLSIVQSHSEGITIEDIQNTVANQG